MSKREKENLLEKIYFNPKNSSSFGSASNLFKAAKKIDPSITKSFVESWLKSRYEYTLFKKTNKKFRRNKILASYINEFWQIDLLDYSKLSRYNEGFKYLINIIDVFSKYLIVIPIKTKSMFEITYKMNILFNRVKPVNLQSDRGREFFNRDFKALCILHKINYFVTQNQTIKCAIVERVNRTIRMRILRYLAHNKTQNYIKVLPDIISAYNKTEHRTIKMRPYDVQAEHEEKVFKNSYGVRNFLELMKKSRKQYKFNENDNVRIKFDPSPMTKENDQKWTDFVYKIRKVYNKFARPQYSVQLDGKPVKRRYYQEELQKINLGKNSNWPVERILRYRTRDNKREALVRWKGYNHASDQWIPMTQIQNV